MCWHASNELVMCSCKCTCGPVIASGGPVDPGHHTISNTQRHHEDDRRRRTQTGIKNNLAAEEKETSSTQHCGLRCGKTEAGWEKLQVRACPECWLWQCSGCVQKAGFWQSERRVTAPVRVGSLSTGGCHEHAPGKLDVRRDAHAPRGISPLGISCRTKKAFARGST